MTILRNVCHQPAPLPNLRVSSIAASPGTLAGTTDYLVTVENDGTGAAGAVNVALKVDGGAPATAQIATLAAGQAATVQLTGPVCVNTLRAVADPRDAIRETNETDNALVTACPS